MEAERKTAKAKTQAGLEGTLLQIVVELLLLSLTGSLFKL